MRSDEQVATRFFLMHTSSPWIYLAWNEEIKCSYFWSLFGLSGSKGTFIIWFEDVVNTMVSSEGERARETILWMSMS